jgi:hypothetical protein
MPFHRHYGAGLYVGGAGRESPPLTRGGERRVPTMRLYVSFAAFRPTHPRALHTRTDPGNVTPQTVKFRDRSG